MGMISKWLYKLIEKERKNNIEEHKIALASNVPTSGSSNDFGLGMTIQIYNATGGRIVKFPKYDHMKDKDNSSVYIIHSDEDFEKCLSQLITAEALKT